MHSFDIRPFVGALPVAFGMSRAEVHMLLGPPRSVSPPTRWRGLCDCWEDGTIQIGYDSKGIVNHTGFGPGNFSLSLVGAPLWSARDHPDPNLSLLRLDPNPVESVGFLVFNRIGIATTGYHDGDEDDLAIVAYPRGAWDESLGRGSAPDLGRYGAPPGVLVPPRRRVGFNPPPTLPSGSAPSSCPSGSWPARGSAGFSHPPPSSSAGLPGGDDPIGG